MSNYSAEILIFLAVGVNFLIAYYLYDWLKSKVDP